MGVDHSESTQKVIEGKRYIHSSLLESYIPDGKQIILTYPEPEVYRF